MAAASWKNKMDDRLNIGNEIRELKLGSSFYNQNNARTSSFHTLKYDFKPASVDLSKIATLDVSSNNQVTVTVPHLDGSGVPKTVFKGNQKNYTKECVLIIDKVTGEITLEKLHHNIQVKKTRSESVNTNKSQPLMLPHPPPKLGLENNTLRTQSKTKVSTGVRKNPISAGCVPKHSPLQGSPLHKSPTTNQQNIAPAWNANNLQSTLPSIPLIGVEDDDDHPMTNANDHSSHLNNNIHHNNHSNNNNIQHSSNLIPNHLISSSLSSMPSIITHPPLLQQQPPQQLPPQLQQQQQETRTSSSSSMPMDHDDIGVLTSSDSSSDSESSSGSDSDSDRPTQHSSPTKPSNGHHNHHHHHHHHHVVPPPAALPAHLLSEDLCLSESNSDSDDSD